MRQILQAERKKRLIAVDEKGRKRVMDGGYTGKINNVNTDLLQLLLEQRLRSNRDANSHERRV